MSQKELNENEYQSANLSGNRDIRMPEQEPTREEQREKSTRNADENYEAESPADPYTDPYDGITDRAQDNINAAENDTTDEDLPE